MSMTDAESDVINLNVSELSLNNVMSISVVNYYAYKTSEVTIISRNIHISLTLVLIVRVLLFISLRVQNHFL